jgi:uncharacterized protein (TIGR00290 family)
MRRKTLLSWSSGKDSAWALHILQQDPLIEVVGLYSVLNEKYNRVSMHSTRAALLGRQAEAAGLELQTIMLPDPCSQEQYAEIMGKFVSGCVLKGITSMAFGDLFLEDIRQHREKQLANTGIDALFPLWKIPTNALAKMMLDGGLEAYISSVDLSKLPLSFAGRQWSNDLLQELPAGVDPCGENGEIHTIVVNGPMFKQGIEVSVGDIVERDGFAYCDIIPI